MFGMPMVKSNVLIRKINFGKYLNAIEIMIIFTESK